MAGFVVVCESWAAWLSSNWTSIKISWSFLTRFLKPPRPGEKKIDTLRISPDQLSCMQWRSTRSLQQFSAQTDLYYPRYCNFSADILKQVPILAGQIRVTLLWQHVKQEVSMHYLSWKLLTDRNTPTGFKNYFWNFFCNGFFCYNGYIMDFLDFYRFSTCLRTNLQVCG